MTTTSQPTRLPRYSRASTEIPFVLTLRDLDILATVHAYRLLTSEHVLALIPGSGQALLRRLQKLYHAGYLDRLLPHFVNGGGSARMVYAITNRGVRTLAEAGRIERAPATDWNAENRSLHDLSVRHMLLVSHVRTVIEKAADARPQLRLLFWQEGRSLYDKAEVAFPEAYRSIPVAPDAFFALEDQKGKMHFFLEADRGTMTTKRFLLKLKAYAAYFQEKRHERKFGIRFFRVLTVTSSPVRQSNLVFSAAEDQDLRAVGRMFLFTDHEKVSLRDPETVLANIWTSLAAEHACSILA